MKNIIDTMKNIDKIKENFRFKGGAIIALFSIFVLMYLMVAGLNYIAYSYIDRVEKDGKINIPTNSTLKQQAGILLNNGYIKDSSDYQTFANMMNLTTVYAGQYSLKKGMSYKDMMSLLNKGKQTPVKVRFTSTYRLENMLSKISSQIEADSTSLMAAIKCDSIQKMYGMDTLSMNTMFIPNTYEFYWNTTAEQFLNRMNKEYKQFWSSREQKLEALKMTKLEVMTLASIVYGETKYSPEMSTVAGVYMNRLRIGMPLQADPTIIFAHQDWDIRRVRNKHLSIKSPYNTYKLKGLPPGPINIPSISAIDAVLDYKKTKYLYFCASEQLDGTHNFATSYNAHLKNARKYSRKLNEMGIK